MKWEEPPAETRDGGRGSKWRTTLEELRQHPGKWARVADGVSAAATAAAIRGGKLGGAQKGEFETRYQVTDSKKDKHKGAVWARYVKGDTDAAQEAGAGEEG
jgi:hypothetical protein